MLDHTEPARLQKIRLLTAFYKRSRTAQDLCHVGIRKVGENELTGHLYHID